MSSDMIVQPTAYSNEQAEQGLLGTILMHSEKALLLQASAIIGAGDMFTPRHSYIFEAMQSLDDLDIITVSDKLSAMGKLKDSGGDAYLTHLLTQATSDRHVTGYANIIKGYAIRRAIISTAKDAIQDCLQNADESPIAQLEGLIGALRGIKLPAQGKTYKQIFNRYIDDHEKAWDDPSHRAGMSWGVQAIDSAFGQIKRGQFIVMAGSPGAGKSLILAHSIRQWLNGGYRVGLFTLEMTNEEYFDRMAQIGSGVNPDALLEKRQNIMRSKIPDDQKERQLDALEADKKRLMRSWSDLFNLPLQISDEPISIDNIESKIYEWAEEAGEIADVYAIDYFGLMGASHTLNRSAKHEQMAYASTTLKNMAKQFKRPFVALAQLNRKGMGTNPPSMDEIAGTVGLVQDPDKVIGIWRPELDDTSLLNLNAVKIRNQAGGGIVRLRQEGLNLKILTTREMP